MLGREIERWTLPVFSTLLFIMLAGGMCHRLPYSLPFFFLRRGRTHTRLTTPLIHVASECCSRAQPCTVQPPSCVVRLDQTCRRTVSHEMIPRGAFRISARVRRNSAIATSSQHRQQHQQTRGLTTPTAAVKKIAAIIMGAPGWLHIPVVYSSFAVLQTTPLPSLSLSTCRCVEVITKK